MKLTSAPKAHRFLMALPLLIPVTGLVFAGQDEPRHRPILIEQQGSFFAGGQTITAPGDYDPTVDTMSDAGQSFQVDHLYAFFQIPAKRSRITAGSHSR